MKFSIGLLLIALVFTGCGSSLFPVSSVDAKKIEYLKDTYKKNPSTLSERDQKFMGKYVSNISDDEDRIAYEAMSSPCDDPLLLTFQAKGWNNLNDMEKQYFIQRLSDCNSYKTSLLIAKEINHLNSGAWARFWTPIIVGAASVVLLIAADVIK